MKKIPKRLQQKFLSAAKRLAIVAKEIGEIHEGANIYLESGWLHLMSGPSHDSNGRGGNDSHQERIVQSVMIPYCDGGAW